MRTSYLVSERYGVAGSPAGISMFRIPGALAQATAWDGATHVAKGNAPRPLDLPGGMTG
jgi:hypothetical protein